MTAETSQSSSKRSGFQAIPILRYSTADLPPSERYRAWLLRDWPRTEPIYRTQAIEPFDTDWESAQLGPLIFAHTKITGMRWERRLQDIRGSDFDPIIINLMIEGLAQGDMDGRPFREPAGSLHFHDLARPSLHVSTASRTYGLVIPRPVAEQWFAPLHDLHGLVIGGEAAAMLFSHAEQVHKALYRLDAALAERLGETMLAITALMLAEVRPHPAARISEKARLRQRADIEIERRLGSGNLGIAELCASLEISRTRLFAAFEGEGGVHAHIMRVRLERSRAALADIQRAEPIGQIAHRLGFSDAPHLSRSFRDRYGMTPSQYRRLLSEDLETFTRPNQPG